MYLYSFLVDSVKTSAPLVSLGNIGKKKITIIFLMLNDFDFSIQFL